MPDLNFFQQIYTQIFTADLVGAWIGPEWLLQQIMNAFATTAITSHLSASKWRITWGPRVFKSSSSEVYEGPDNTWMVCMAPDVAYPDGSKCDTYVVSVAGTAYFSATDWMQEDFGVGHVVSFEGFTRTFQEGKKIVAPQKTKKVPGEGPYCAWGTAWGVYEVVRNVSPEGNPGEGSTVLEYLKGLGGDGREFRVIFGGHSLGGALAPFLSLAVKTNGLIPALKDKPENILTFPAAGPTFGDGPLRHAYNKLFPVSGPGGYQQFNADLYNSLDIVPQSWSTNKNDHRHLDNIVSIYGKLSTGLHIAIKAFVETAKEHAEASGVAYEPIEGDRFTGTPPAQVPTSLYAFVAEAVKQHVKAYHDEVGVGDTLAQIYSVGAGVKGARKKTTYQAARSLPVLCLAADLMKDIPEGVHGGDENDERGEAPGAPKGDVDLKHPYDCILLR